jgi:putative hydrolase of the HAD superfamily
MPLSCVVLDLGNVLFKIDFDKCYGLWAKRTGLTVQEIRSRFSFDAVYQKYERGELRDAAYHEHVRGLLAAELSFNDFSAGWNAIYGPVIPETLAFMEQVQGRMRLCAFSNTNALHIGEWSVRYAKALEPFERIYCSSAMGLRKPDPKAFERIAHELALQPAHAVFVDDLLENVRAARSIGMQGVHFDDPARAMTELKSLIER